MQAKNNNEAILDFIAKVNKDKKLMDKNNFVELLKNYAKLIRSLKFLENLLPRKINNQEEFYKFSGV